GLSKLLATHAPKSLKEEKLDSYKGKRIAIDVGRSIYKFLIVVGSNEYGTLTNQFGEVTSHLQGMFYRTARLLEAGMMPVFVFDGEPPDLKKDLMTRFPRREESMDYAVQGIKPDVKTDIAKYNKQTVKVTKRHNEDCKNLLTLMGVPVVQAPCEAEAECASLCKVGKVDAVSSDDTDSLVFGAPRFLRHLTESPSRKIAIMDIELSKVLEELNLTMDQFVDMCIFSGCSYCDSIGGIGPQTSLKLIREHGSIEKILENIDKDRFQIPVHWPYLRARRLFKEPQITPLEYQPKLQWSTPDKEGLKKFLVDENGFSYERVMK
ncbi:hypothetical protein KI387_009122, partial [Taxus chinensis]